MPRRRAGQAILPLLAALAACGSDSPGDARAESAPSASDGAPVAVTDAAGRRVTLPAPARRVVSLVPSVTLTLDALGARAVLVGRTDFDTVAWAAGVPSVGGGLSPSLEALVSLAPDLVVRFAGAQDRATPERLDALGIAHAAVRPDDIEEIFESIRVVGTLVGRAGAADSLVARLRSRLDSVRTAWAGAPRPRVAYVLGGTPPWVAGPGTYIDELIELAGGENAFADLETLYASVSLEEFVARDIDVILVHRDGDFRARFAGGTPIREVSDILELPGPAVAEAAAEVADAIHRPEPR